MAKTVAPLMSASASGKFGDIVFFRRKGLNLARLRTTPANPKTAGQVAARLNLGNLSKIYNGGGVLAALTIGAGNSAVRYEALKGGVVGNAIRIAYIDPPGNLVPLSVGVSGNDITVTLATDGASAITSTALQVRDAIRNHPGAGALVRPYLPPTSNGTGVVLAAALTFLVGGVDAGPFAVRRSDKLAEPVVYTDANEAILTAAEKATWADMQAFISYNATRLAANLAVVRTKP